MTERTDRVYLPPEVGRCTRTAATCRLAEQCARAVAALPPRGATLGDYLQGAVCEHHISLATARGLRDTGQAPPRVLPPLRGIAGVALA